MYPALFLDFVPIFLIHPYAGIYFLILLFAEAEEKREKGCEAQSAIRSSNQLQLKTNLFLQFHILLNTTNLYFSDSYLNFKKNIIIIIFIALYSHKPDGT